MSTNNGKTSAGRARGHSMYSSLKATTDEQITSGELPGDHGGISAARLREKASPEFNRGPIAQESKTSLLTTALQAALPGVATSAPINIKGRANVSSPHPSNSQVSTDESSSDTEHSPIKDEELLRKWCTGQPPKKSFLGSGRLPFSRRSTLADKPELDVLLALTKKNYKGHGYLPLTARTIHRLSPFWKGEKPIADTKVFDCIMIDAEINGVHADHVVAALERIGTFCKHLLVVAGVKTTELGTVFNREAGNIPLGNDWDCILKCFPNLRHLAFIHPVGEPVAWSRDTLFALHLAVAKRQSVQETTVFKCEVPAKLITHLADDMAAYYGKSSS